MLQDAYLLAKIGAETAENERNFAEIYPKLATTLRVRTLDAGPLLANWPADEAPRLVAALQALAAAPLSPDPLRMESGTALRAPVEAKAPASTQLGFSLS